MSETLNNPIYTGESSVYIVNCASGLVIDTSQSPVIQWNWNATGAQPFTVTPVPGEPGYYQIVQNGKALDVESSTKNNAPVYLNQLNTGAASQQWAIAETATNFEIAFQNKASDLFLSVSPPLQQAGSQLVQYTAEASGAQTWLLARAKCSFLIPNFPPPNQRAMDNINSSSSAGSRYQVYQWSDSNNAQIFLDVPIDIHYSILINLASGLPLTGASGIVTQEPWFSSEAQKWALIDQSSNQIYLVQNKASGGYINAGNESIGTELTCTPVVGTAWQFVPIALSEDEEIPEKLV